MFKTCNKALMDIFLKAQKVVFEQTCNPNSLFLVLFPLLLALLFVVIYPSITFTCFHFSSLCSLLLNVSSNIFPTHPVCTSSRQPLVVPVLCPLWHGSGLQWWRFWGGWWFWTSSVWVQVHSCTECVNLCVAACSASGSVHVPVGPGD